MYARHDGNARAARDEMQQIKADLLGPDHTLPSLKFFKRMEEKVLLHNTVEDLVIKFTFFMFPVTTSFYLTTIESNPNSPFGRL